MRRLGVLIVKGLFAMIGVVVLINIIVLVYPKGKIYKNIQEAPHLQTVLVLGAQVYRNGSLSRALKDRVNTGIGLYRAGKVGKILVSGDHGRLDYDEVNAMRRYILRQGIPAQDIFMDHAGFDTYDSLYRARAVFGVESAILVSQGFHLKRALYIARGVGLEAVGVKADKPYLHDDTGFRGECREVMARVKAFGEVFVQRRPKFLGETIPITGDGRLTMDQLR